MKSMFNRAHRRAVLSGTALRDGRVRLVAGSLALVLLGACGEKVDDQTTGQKVDRAIAKTEQAAAEAKAKTESAMAAAGASIKEAAQKAEAAGKNMADKAEDKLDDASITAAVKAALAKDADLNSLQLNVDTVKGAVLLKGAAPNTAARDRATSIAKAVKGVTSVNNQLTVPG